MFQRPKVIDPKTPTPKMAEENQNIQVFVRSRPLKSTEKKSNLELIPEKSSIKFSQQNKFYSFDNVFDTKAKQIDVYRSVVEPLVEQVVEGYNCTVFAYGQTGTGKTYTMVGDRSDKEVSWEDDPTSGVIPRAIDQLIDLLQCQDTEYTIRVSFLELYNEDAYDLLSPIIDQNKLRIYNDSERKGSVIISGLVELIVKTKAEIFEILEKGSYKRQTAPTLMNACSSRSHSIFSITVHIKEITLEGEEVVKMGKLNLVDLAGSENIGRSGAVEERFREAQNINKSLLTLGRVITSLVERSPHIPYRDSKLTRLLQDSLGGKTKTSIIATISPCIDDLEDTLSTLDYAQRAKKITNKPEVNLKMSKKTLISEYLIEIDKLRRDLDAARDKNLGKGIYVDAKNYACMEATLKEQEQNLELKEARIDQLQTDVNKWTNLLTEANANLSEKSEELDDLNNQLKYLIADLDSTRQLLNQTKMEVEQQKVLVESHQITEQKLLGQAKSIMDVADKCVSSNELLHGKVDKLSTLESDNINIRNQFLGILPDQFEKINQMNTNIFDAINDGYASIEKSISDNKSALVDKGFDLKSSFKKIVSTVESFSDRILDLYQKDISVTKETENLKLVLANFKSDVFSIMDASYKDFIGNKQKSTTAYELLVADSLKKRSQLEEIVMNEISKLNETSKHVTSTIKSIKEDLVQNLSNKCTENQKLKEEIAKLIQVNTKNEMALKQLFEISEVLNKNSLEIKESLANCEERIDVSSCNETGFTNGLSIKSDELVAFVQKEKVQVETFLSNVDQHGQNNCQNIIDKCTEFKNLQIQMEADYQSQNKAAISLIENTITLVNNQIDTKVNDVLVKSFEDKTDCVNELKFKTSDLTNSTDVLTESLIQMASQNEGTTLDTYKDMQSYCDAYKSSQEHLIDDCLKSCHDYYKNGFKLYEPTGITPKKTSYNYPKELACTSPHERIIARYKENLLLKENNNNTSNGFLCEQKSIENEIVVDENEQTKTEDKTFIVNKVTIPEKSKNKRKQLKERN